MTRPRPIGDSRLLVYPIGLGAMPLSLKGRPAESEARKVILAALDAGMDFIDTADVYCLDDHDTGHNERLIAEALREWKGDAEVVVATKGGLRRPGGDWVHDASPARLREACEASLKALGRDCIGLYQLHAPDEKIPFEDSVYGLAELREEGKIRHVGLSNVSVEQIRAAQKIVPVVSVQNQASLYRPEGLTDGVLRHCEEAGLAFIAYSPVGGWQAGKIAHEPVLQELAAKHGASPHQVALAWLLHKSPVIIPIPGASRPENAMSSARAAEIALPPHDLEWIDQIFLA